MLESSRYKWTLSDGVMTRAAFGNVNRYSKGEGVIVMIAFYQIYNVGKHDG